LVTTVDNNVYLWSSIGREWTCYCPATGFVTVGESREQALERFGMVWNQRGEYRVIDSAPPRARRDDDARTAAPAREQDDAAVLYRELARHFQPDRNSVGAVFTPDQVMNVLNRLWDALKGRA
jgi:hypothetical protein